MTIKYYGDHIQACLELKRGELIYWNRELKQWYISTPESERVRKEKESKLKEKINETLSRPKGRSI